MLEKQLEVKDKKIKDLNSDIQGLVEEYEAYKEKTILQTQGSPAACSRCAELQLRVGALQTESGERLRGLEAKVREYEAVLKTSKCDCELE